MNLILNRNFELPADGWHQLAPLGEFPHAAAGITQVIDEAACRLMVASFDFQKNSSENFPGLLIDFDHFSLDASRHSEAAGWITDLKFIPLSADRCPPSSGPTGLLARIRWSDTGEAAVRGGRYRFLSPVWSRTDCEDLGDNRLRPVRLLNAAVTNDPNLKGILPLSNRSVVAPQASSLKPQASSSFDFPPLDENQKKLGGRQEPHALCPMPNAEIKKENPMQPVIDALLNKLNLAADTPEPDIITAVAALSSPEEITALTNRAETAEAQIAQLQQAQLEADADAFCEANAAVIENRDQVRAQFIENRTLTEALFINLKLPKASSLQPQVSPSPQPLHNRDSKLQATRNRDATTSEAMAVKIRNRASEILNTERIAFTEAFRRAEQELSNQ